MADLITLEDYKEAEGLTTVNEDTRLNVLIPSVSQLVKTYCGVAFVDYFASDKTEYFNIDFLTHSIFLDEGPFVSLTSVKERASYDSAYVELTEAAQEVYVDTSTDSILRTNGGTGYKYWPCGPGAVEVIYKAGYSAIPTDLKLAVLDLITYYHKNEHKLNRSLGGASVTNARTNISHSAEFPDHIKRVLDLYKA